MASRRPTRRERQGKTGRQGRQARVMSHRARRSRAEPPDEAVELAAAEVRRAFEAWAARFVELLVRDYVRPSFRADAEAWRLDATIRGLFNEAGRAKPRAEVFERAFTMLDKQSADELRVTGVPTRAVVPQADARKQEWLRSNTDLIRAEEDMRRRVERILQDPLNQGRSVGDIAKMLEEQAGYSTSRAVLTARDQTLKLYGQVQQERQQNAGIERYVWTTSLDERVREDHAALDGTIQRWDDPPIVDRRTGRRGHPGFDFQCRCTAVGVLDEPAEGEQPAEQRRQVELRQRAIAGGRFAPPPPPPPPPPRRPPPPEPIMKPSKTEVQAERELRRRQAEAEARRRKAEREADLRIAKAKRKAAEAERKTAEAARLEAERKAAEAERKAAEAKAKAEAARLEAERKAAEARARAEAERLERERLAAEAQAKAAVPKVVPVVEVFDFKGTEPKAKTAKFWRATSQRNYDAMSMPQKTAIGAFVHSDYAALRALQEGQTPEQVAAQRFGPSIERARELKAMLPELKQAQRRLSVQNPTQYGVLYRGLKLEQEQLDKILNGSTFEFKAGSNSTSYSFDTATFFAAGFKREHRAVVLRIKKVREGAFVGFKENTNRGETEVVVSNRKFNITGKQYDTFNSRWVIDLEETAESAARADANDPALTQKVLAPVDEREGRFWSNGWDIAVE